MEKTRNLRKIRQIGTPSDGDRIYIENAAYARIHEEEYSQRRAFIFMGHTECMDGVYTTFVEAAIPVRDLQYEQNVPRWNNHAWSDVFREIKRSYENSIIVGWALDIKGFQPRMTKELELVHREQFGGAHQVLLLMDSLEGDETFFLNKGNSLQKKDGFYIYYSGDLYKVDTSGIQIEMQNKRTKTVYREENEQVKGRYREVVRENPVEKKERKTSSYAMVAAMVLLGIVFGAGILENKIQIPGFENVVSTMKQKISGQGEPAEALIGTEFEEESQTVQETETLTETLDLIPIEEVPSGEIKKLPEKEEKPKQENQNVQKEEVKKEKNNEAKKEKDTGKKEVSAQATKIPEYYVIQEGDTLTAICNKVYGSTKKMSELTKLNHLESADELKAGQKLLLP